MKSFQEYIVESKKGAPKRIPQKRGGGSYMKFLSKDSKHATVEDTRKVVKKMSSKLGLGDIRDGNSGKTGHADSKANTLTTDNMISAVGSIGGTNIKFYDGRDGVVSYSRVFFELDGKAYAIDARRFDNGNATMDFEGFSSYL